MLSTNSTEIGGIGHGHFPYELEETEGSRGSGGMSHMVVGGDHGGHRSGGGR